MKPIMIDFPDEFHTERLVIRMPKPGDGKVVFEAVNASIDELKPWLKFSQNEQNEYDIELEVREAHVRFLSRENLRFFVFLKETGQFVATSSLHNITKNTRSKLIPERLQFELESIIKNEDLSVDGSELRDTYIFAKIQR
ncbi:GNAT family N-acetyltransferase [Paenibacillus silviterrae]|uniref:GNAT family N-acetyltransferase n=1 Tax=Paenibacillus silviterrae TaxID=3242194 RepID=UPI0025435135|nr:GNAT family N-acetyltransferase [Paenibacillus chinjuensis]